MDAYRNYNERLPIVRGLEDALDAARDAAKRAEEAKIAAEKAQEADPENDALLTAYYAAVEVGEEVRGVEAEIEDLLSRVGKGFFAGAFDAPVRRVA